MRNGHMSKIRTVGNADDADLTDEHKFFILKIRRIL